jgi:hypothetical protein
VHYERNFKQKVKKTYLEKIDVQKKIDDATDLNKILKLYKEIKRTAKKQGYKQLHVQKKKRPKKKAKHLCKTKN